MSDCYPKGSPIQVAWVIDSVFMSPCTPPVRCAFAAPLRRDGANMPIPGVQDQPGTCSVLRILRLFFPHWYLSGKPVDHMGTGLLESP
jgi:hypothetical protein